MLSWNSSPEISVIMFWVFVFHCIYWQECSLSPQGAASLMNPQSLIRHMQSNHIQCIASGGQPPNYKFFFYAQKDGATLFFLVECIVNTASAKAQLKIKADDGTAAEAFSTLFQSALSKFGLSWSWAFSFLAIHWASFSAFMQFVHCLLPVALQVACPVHIRSKYWRMRWKFAVWWRSNIIRFSKESTVL